MFWESIDSFERNLSPCPCKFNTVIKYSLASFFNILLLVCFFWVSDNTSKMWIFNFLCLTYVELLQHRYDSFSSSWSKRLISDFTFKLCLSQPKIWSNVTIQQGGAIETNPFNNTKHKKCSTACSAIHCKRKLCIWTIARSASWEGHWIWCWDSKYE